MIGEHFLLKLRGFIFNTNPTEMDIRALEDTGLLGCRTDVGSVEWRRWHEIGSTLVTE